jgi:hypothetical protein
MNAYRDADDEAEDWDDDEADDEGDATDGQDEEPTVPCPSCRREILEDSPRCPYCERYVSAEDDAVSGKPLWVTLTALICLGVAIWWLFVAF